MDCVEPVPVRVEKVRSAGQEKLGEEPGASGGRVDPVREPVLACRQGLRSRLEKTAVPAHPSTASPKHVAAAW